MVDRHRASGALSHPRNALSTRRSTARAASSGGEWEREAKEISERSGHFYQRQKLYGEVLIDGAIPADFRHNLEAWVGCLAGALEIDAYQQMLAEAGFEAIGVEITRRYTAAEAGLDLSTLPAGWEADDGKLASAFVRATKPVTATPVRSQQHQATDEVSSSSGCCGGGCCEA